MRDHEILRTQLIVALALGLGGCTNTEEPPKAAPSSPSESAQADAEDKSDEDRGSAGREPDDRKGGVGSLVKEIKADAEQREGKADGTEPVVAVDPTEHCGSAKRTLTVTQAEANRRTPSEELGCPTRTDMPAAFGPRRVTLNRPATQALRDAGDEEHCCYRVVRPVKGRPLVASGRLMLPEFEWGPQREQPGTEPQIARRVAAAWLRDARLEWASVRSFERAAEELRQLGAPLSLRTRYQSAANDERRHTAQCLRWAEHYAGRSIRLCELPPVEPRAGDRLSCLRTTFIEGGVAETAAALIALRSARRPRDPIASTLRAIAADEAEHAALAWATIGWLLSRCSEAERAGFVSWARQQRPECVVPGVDPDALHGRLGSQTEQAITAEAWERCIVPALDELGARLTRFEDAQASGSAVLGPASRSPVAS